MQEQIVTYVDFDIPWNLTANYKFVYSKTGLESNKENNSNLKFLRKYKFNKKMES